MAEVVLYSPATGGWVRYARPRALFRVREHGQVLPLLEELEAEVERHGLHAAGFLSYEAGAAFDAAMPCRSTAFPLAWFGLFDPPLPVSLPSGHLPALPWIPELDATTHATALARIRALLQNGESYQVNFTYRLRTPWQDDPWAAFCALVRRQPSPHAAYVDTGDYAVCCASPESFFERVAGLVWSRPMKGTAARGRWQGEDREAGLGLAASVKDRAENVMIVDMVRNDLGRVCAPGSVLVPELCTVERYPTVWQMTSLVCGSCHGSTARLMAALFPAASITGAPKISTMRAIQALEPSSRHIYTGTIGVLEPGQRARFNVAIRTVLVDRAARQAEYGVGGGIVWDSDPAAEYQETRLKARILSCDCPEFRLIETMRWSRVEGILLRERHLARLADSAAYFDFVVDRAALEQALEVALRDADGAEGVLRLLLERSGAWSLEHRPLPPAGPCRVALAARPVDSRDAFLFHKTTIRQVYAAARRERPDVDDVLLWNERGEITEATIASVVAELEGEKVTPPLSGGLLPGVLRTELLATGAIRESVLRVEDLSRITGLWLVSAVRGWRRAELVEREPGGN